MGSRLSVGDITKGLSNELSWGLKPSQSRTPSSCNVFFHVVLLHCAGRSYEYCVPADDSWLLFPFSSFSCVLVREYVRHICCLRHHCWQLIKHGSYKEYRQDGQTVTTVSSIRQATHKSFMTGVIIYNSEIKQTNGYRMGLKESVQRDGCETHGFRSPASHTARLPCGFPRG